MDKVVVESCERISWHCPYSVKPDSTSATLFFKGRKCVSVKLPYDLHLWGLWKYGYTWKHNNLLKDIFCRNGNFLQLYFTLCMYWFRISMSRKILFLRRNGLVLFQKGSLLNIIYYGDFPIPGSVCTWCIACFSGYSIRYCSNCMCNTSFGNYVSNSRNRTQNR